jgi:hypothetical protein
MSWAAPVGDSILVHAGRAAAAPMEPMSCMKLRRVLDGASSDWQLQAA